jgi:hypothetical protein
MEIKDILNELLIVLDAANQWQPLKAQKSFPHWLRYHWNYDTQLQEYFNPINSLIKDGLRYIDSLSCNQQHDYRALKFLLTVLDKKLNLLEIEISDRIEKDETLSLDAKKRRGNGLMSDLICEFNAEYYEQIQRAHSDIKPVQKRQSPRWDDYTIASLQGLMNQGMNQKEIAAELSRRFNKKYTHAAVRCQLKRMRNSVS